MTIPHALIEQLKWAIYDWIGTVSVAELAANRRLGTEIEKLCKRLSAMTATT
jgi:hypothetical protein